MSNISDEDLNRLFPVPTMGSTLFTRTLLPGCSSDASQALAELLRRNFCPRKPFKDPISQQLFAIWASGGLRSLLQAANDAPLPRPRNECPVEITIDNWKDFLGNVACFTSYRKFFVNQISTNTFEYLLYTFIFSPSANFDLTLPPKEPPLMINRLFSGVLHPFLGNIIVGHATEFDIPGMLVEGLSSTAVSKPIFNNIIPMGRGVQVQDQLSQLSLNSNTLSTTVSTTSNVDEGYSSENEDIGAKDPGNTVSKSITTVNIADNVEKRIRMLGFLTTIIYGVGGLQGKLPFKADFNLMNLTAASFFNHSVLKYLSAHNQDVLLNTFLSATLQMWVKAGRPPIDINNFYNHTTANPQPPGCIPTPHPTALDRDHMTPNSFYRILQSAMMHPNPHLSKFQRGLSLFSAWYGTTPSGSFTADDFPSGDNAPVIAGIDRLDGTLFVRVAGLTADRLGWVREGEAPRGWDGE